MEQKTFTVNETESAFRYLEGLKVGDEVVLTENKREGAKQEYWSCQIAPDGIGGNMNSAVKRYHGWRGTTDGLSVTAHGLRKVQKIVRGVNKEGEETLKITVGPDLHPEWD